MRFDMLAAPRLVCAAALLSLSCTRTLDFDELSSEGPSDDSGVPPVISDAAASPTPTATTDERPTLEAGVADDAGFSCRTLTPAPAFCDDFDTLPLATLWDEILRHPEGSGTLDHDGDDALSPAHSLLATVRSGIGGAPVAVAVRKSLGEIGQRPTRIEIDFDMKLEQFDPTPGRNIVAFQLVLGALDADFLGNQLALEVHSGDAQVHTRFDEHLLSTARIADSSELHELRPGLPVGRWSHVSFALDLAEPAEPASSNNHAQVRIGPRETFSRDAVTLFQGRLRYGLHAARPRMEIGIPWLDTEQESETWRIRYDNVVVRLSPE